MATFGNWSLIKSDSNSNGAALAFDNVSPGDVLVVLVTVAGQAHPGIEKNTSDLHTLNSFSNIPVLKTINKHTTVEKNTVKKGKLVTSGHFSYWDWTTNTSVSTDTDVTKSQDSLLTLGEVYQQRSGSSQSVEIQGKPPLWEKPDGTTLPAAEIVSFSVWHYRPSVSPDSGHTLVRHTLVKSSIPPTHSPQEMKLPVAAGDIFHATAQSLNGEMGDMTLDPSLSATQLVDYQKVDGDLGFRYRMWRATSDGEAKVQVSNMDGTRHMVKFEPDAEEVKSSAPTVSADITYFEFWPEAESTGKYIFGEQFESMFRLMRHNENFGLIENFTKEPLAPLRDDDSGNIERTRWREAWIMGIPTTQNNLIPNQNALIFEDEQEMRARRVYHRNFW